MGRALSFDGGPVTVVGVLPATFDFSTVFTPGSRVDMFEPLPLSPEMNREGNTVAIIGRLKPGVSVEQARAETTVLGKLLQQEHKERNDFEPKVSGLAQHVSGQTAADAAGAGVRGGRGDADCVREPFEFVAGAGSDAAKKKLRFARQWERGAGG